MKSRGKKIGLCLWFAMCIAVSAVLSVHMLKNSKEEKELKKDYFLVNQIKYGLLSGNNWVDQVNSIISARIDSFDFTPANRKVLMQQTNLILKSLLDELDKKIHEDHPKWTDKIKFRLISVFIDIRDFKEEIPRYSKAIVDELSRSGNKNKVKQMLQEKVASLLNATNQDLLGEQAFILKIHGEKSIGSFNAHVAKRSAELDGRQRQMAIAFVGMLALVALSWIYISRHDFMSATSFLFSVIISFGAMVTGVCLPMIEIDARIAKLDLELMGGHVIFKDQVIFFQAKSIVDVVHILIINGTADTMLVGCLILVFSVLFPFTKLICTTIYLFSRNKHNRFVHFMAFNSGKWSMADVMVVAIFMAYVGFKGILDNQLADINMRTEQINLITTDKTNLQPGFIVFVGFVVFNLLLAEFLKVITSKKKQNPVPA